MKESEELLKEIINKISVGEPILIEGAPFMAIEYSPSKDMGVDVIHIRGWFVKQ